MAELWLVRHGQTDWNVTGLYQGQTDIPLNAAGLAQAEKLASGLAGQHFAALFSSDLARASRTAQAAADVVGLAVQVDRRLREINQGEWEGRDYRKIVAQYGDPAQLSPEEIRMFRAPGGESIQEVAERMAAAADDIAAKYPTGRVLVVSHGLALALLYCQAQQIPIHRVYWHILENAVPTVVTWAPQRELI